MDEPDYNVKDRLFRVTHVPRPGLKGATGPLAVGEILTGARTVRKHWNASFPGEGYDLPTLCFAADYGDGRVMQYLPFRILEPADAPDDGLLFSLVAALLDAGGS